MTLHEIIGKVEQLTEKVQEMRSFLVESRKQRTLQTRNQPLSASGRGAEKAALNEQAVQDARARGSLSTAEFITNGLREAARIIREEGNKKEPTDPLSRQQTRLDLTLQLLKKAMDPDEMGVEDVKWLVRAMQCLQWSRDAGLAVVEGIETAEQIMQMENCDESIAENGTGRGTPAASSHTGNFQRGGTVPGAGCDLVPDVLSRGSAEAEGCDQQPVRRSGAAGGDGAGCSGEEHF